MQTGLIFDMDGVLVDSAEPHFRSWQQMAREIGREMPEQAFRQTFGRQNRAIIPLVFGIADPIEVERLSERKEEIYREIIREHIPVKEGAIELIQACRAAGFRLAIGSSGPPENVETVLAGMGVQTFFDVLITARQVQRGKPDPQVFSLAAKQLGLPPARCVVVEDAPAGIEAALRAGCKAIALAGEHPVEQLDQAHLLVHSLRELTPECILDLIGR